MSTGNELLSPADLDLIKILDAHTANLNTPPLASNLRDTPDKKAKYIPIGIIENMLRQDFHGLVKINVISERTEINEYIVVARISVFHTIARQWLEYDGIGCVQIMQDSGAPLSDFLNTKKKNALERNAPRAYAQAVKNAAKKIGKKYGADLNRKDEDEFVEVASMEEDEYESLDMLMRDMTSIAEVNKLIQVRHKASKKIMDLFNRHRERISKLPFNPRTPTT